MTSLDRVILVDCNDRKIGEMDKLEAHRGNGRLHRAVSVFLFDPKGRLLIQQRSEMKIVGAYQWANTCCGNVRPGESRPECAKRRLSEELGIKDIKVSQISKFVYFARCNEEFSEAEVDGVFVGMGRPLVALNPAEAMASNWIEWEKFKDEVGADKQGMRFTPWTHLMLDNTKVFRSIELERERICSNNIGKKAEEKPRSLYGSVNPSV